MTTSLLAARRWIASLAADLRFAARSMARRPAFTVTVVTTLALGIGANTAVFSLVDAVILHPLTVGHVDQLVALYEPARGTPFGGTTLRHAREIEARTTSLTGAAAHFGSTLSLTDGDAPQALSITFVSDNYFAVLGVSAQLGRTIAPIDSAEASAGGVVVLSDALWRGRFGGDRAIVGKPIHLDGQPLTVIGVVSERFRGTDLAAPPDAWVRLPTAVAANLNIFTQNGVLDADVPIYGIVGRLAPGMTRERAAAELTLIVRGITVVPLAEAASGVRDRAELVRFVRLLFGVVALTLLLACVNVANLLVVRGTERFRELGVRTALGASTRRLVQQLLTESFVLAVAGGVVGLVVAMVMLRLLAAYTLPGGVALQRLDLGLDPRVLAFTCGMSCLTAVGFGLIPAVSAASANVVDALRGREGSASRRHGRSVLLAVQVAISLMLIVGAGLFLRSVKAGLDTDLGFDPRPIAAVSVQTKFDGRHADVIRPLLAIVEQTSKAPGVIAAAASSHVPLANTPKMRVAARGGLRDTIFAPTASVTSDFFKVMGMSLVAGRSFDAGDRASAPRVVVLNETAARTLFPNDAALGRHIDLYGTDFTVVGVVRDVKYTTLQDRGVPFVYAPMEQQDFFGRATLLVRSAEPRPALAMLERAVRIIGPELKVLDNPAYRPRLVSDQIATVLAPQRFGATLMSVFALIALCVSGVGIHGTVAHVVARRTTEIGVRMALGARAADVLSLVLRESGLAIGGGVGLGLTGALLTSKLLEHYLYEVTTTDLVALTGAVAVVAVMSIIAVLIPATRAVRVDPARAIRAS